MRDVIKKLALVACFFSSSSQAAALTIDVYRDANCGCCTDWIKHLESNGIAVRDHVERDMSAIKRQFGVAPRLASCHTGVLDGKFIEGHVPAEQIAQLQTRTDLRGIAVPGMPKGSMGMDYGDTKDHYAVIGLTQEGNDEVLAEYVGGEKMSR